VRQDILGDGAKGVREIMSLNILRTAFVALLVCWLASPSAFAQQFDNSADTMLSGTYAVRELLVTKLSVGGAIGRSAVATGLMSFSGSGEFSFSGQILDSTVPGGPVPTTSTGTFAVAANGFLKMQSLVGVTPSGPDTVWGGVGAAGPNAFVGSATDGPNFDIIVGIPLATGLRPSNFKGLYATAYLDFWGGLAGYVHNAYFVMAPDGNNEVAFAIPPTGSDANVGNTILVDSIGGVPFTLPSSNGGTLAFPTDATGVELIAGNKTFYLSPDGNLVLGGDPDDYDLLVATPVSPSPSNADVTGFYFLSGLEEDTTRIAQGLYTYDAWYGSSNANGAGASINHQHMTETFPNAENTTEPADWTFSTNYSVSAQGVFQPAPQPGRYVEGASGQVIVGTGGNGLYSISLGLQQSFNGAGVFLNPLGIANAASFAPPTNPVAPLEILLLSGDNLAPSAANATGFPLPRTLVGTNLLINGQKAPLISVSPTLITAVVPRSIAPDYDALRFATFQVMNNGTASNAVTMFVSAASPGVFTLAGGGTGPAAIRHGLNDTQVVDAGDPATTNEVVEIFVNGLGGVTPGVPDGEQALPFPGLSMADGAVRVFINNIESPSVQFAGLAPGYAGLGQINAVVPPGTGSGDLSLTVSTPDSVTVQTTINVQDTGAAATDRAPDGVRTRR
jgi:uncharacterized protein (TIGR03437 family)